jgi:hypothetical protein
MTGLAATPIGPNVLRVTAAFELAGRSRAGTYVLLISAHGVTDRAGNPLDERFFVAFPGFGSPTGQDYLAQFTTNGRSPAGPQLFISPAERRAAIQHNNFIRSRLRGR